MRGVGPDALLHVGWQPAQDATAEVPTRPTSGCKVFVTGSNIPTVDRETAVPVQVITREEIQRANFQTAASSPIQYRRGRAMARSRRTRGSR